MFKIIFSRKCKQSTVVQADIDTGIFCELPVLPFTWQCDKQYTAALLEQYLNDKLASTIETAHRLAYQRGWDDKRKKKKRATLFSEEFTNKQDNIAW